ncbi:sensor domain-containing phosphodiesterase [Aureimonas jatrophae]|uniref:EAL domain, c-di-GMP-specific phosphodiesterase class I (Or its enzymatically inactive variant) n=1 Tax=Aureimonas jatrophae TaxID=1166073 RepID=A0A1H0EYB3_9HYPH|nr:EAL domain-containing protein [Aureimonas jatrophae]MBB3950261.1 EAL domain-containing protein (putative c-di-GMP-specific phosphodiesterase class I) [Aureimonas jatrophae]SDN87331.1 EAL domain, c-di-GMP-specific phosphodiesterase class I (or its enzymatically inactive variant) [Aureimonas jatrophae]
MELVRLFDNSSHGGFALSPDIDRVLKVVRTHLRMDVSFVSRFEGRERVIGRVDAEAAAPIAPGDRGHESETYCGHIVSGQLPELIRDTAQVPGTACLSATGELGIGAHVGVPLVLSDGSVYGTFCCFRYTPDLTLSERDVETMRAFADLIAHRIEREEEERRESEAKRRRINEVLAAGGPAIVYQPIVMLDDLRVVGAEALARFSQEPRRTPDRWFGEAAEVGLGTELELAAIRNAIEGFRPFWREWPFQLGVNCSAQVVTDGGLEAILREAPSDRIVLELTEHDKVEDYWLLNEALDPLRALGVRIAVDDAGSGYASMRHILTTRPNIIKLDISLTKDIDRDPMRRALIAALNTFADGFDGRLVAEGVETERELETLRELKVQAAQGYHIGRPMAAGEFRRFLAQR